MGSAGEEFMLLVKRSIVFIWVVVLVSCAKPNIELGSAIEIPGSDFSIRPFVDYQLNQLENLLFIRKSSWEKAPSFVVSGSEYDGRITYESWETEMLNCDGTSEIAPIESFSWQICHQTAQDENELSFTTATLIHKEQAILISMSTLPEEEDEAIAMLNALLSSVSYFDGSS